MAKTTVNLSTGFYEFDQHGPIHVTKNGQYSGCIEFRGGFGPITYKMVQSAIDNAVEYFQPNATKEDIVAIGNAIREIMKPLAITLTSEQMGLIYAGLACGACVARENGHTSDANEFHTVMELVDDMRMSDFSFKIGPS